MYWTNSKVRGIIFSSREKTLSTGRAWPRCIVGLNQNGEKRQIHQGLLWQNYEISKKCTGWEYFFFFYATNGLKQS